MSEKYRVAITCGHIGSVDIEREELRGIAEVHVSSRELSTEDEVLSFAGDADGLLLGDREPITRRVIENMPNLKALVRYGIGVDNIDVKAATERGVLVANVPDYGIDEVADHTFALILALTRKIMIMDRGVRAGKWRDEVRRMIEPIHSYSSQTLGLLGFGKIARRVAVRAKAFKFKVVSYDPWAPRWEFSLLDVERAPSLEELLKHSDILSIHVPLTPETRHMIGGRELSLMKPGAFIVNTSRGAIIDQMALCKALEEGWIAGAALDVFEVEPIEADNPLLKMENVILTPHMAWYTEEAMKRLKREAARSMALALSGRRPEFIVNPEVLEKK